MTDVADQCQLGGCAQLVTVMNWIGAKSLLAHQDERQWGVDVRKKIASDE